MINEEKVILMTRAALYEEKERKRQLKISDYYRHDYISLQMLIGWFFGTLSFLLGVVLWGAYHMEYLLDNIHKMDLKSLGFTVLWLYVLVMIVYLGFLYALFAHRYRKAGKSVNGYGQTLRKISDIYEEEEKSMASDIQMEDIKHDSIT